MKTQKLMLFLAYILTQTEIGHLKYRPCGTIAASDRVTLKINGKQSHDASSWYTVVPKTQKPIANFMAINDIILCCENSLKRINRANRNGIEKLKAFFLKGDQRKTTAYFTPNCSTLE